MCSLSKKDVNQIFKLKGVKTMRKIENEKDWNNFVADVEYHLGEEGHYTNGVFGVLQNADDVPVVFFTEFDVDSDGYYWLNPLFKEWGGCDWKSGSGFFYNLSKSYAFPFYIRDYDHASSYSWL